MKPKLLKKIRQRFKWHYHGSIQYPFRLYWKVMDCRGTETELKEHISHFCIGDMVRIHCPTIAEQLAIDVMGIMYVYRHREHRAKMKNKRFKNKYFNA